MLQTLYDCYRTLRFIARHPVSAGRRWAALLGYARWQLGKRFGLIRGPVRTRFVNASQLLVYERFADSVGVLYTELPESWEMGFILESRLLTLPQRPPPGRQVRWSQA